MPERNDVLQAIARKIGFLYPLRWADQETTLGDYEGRDLTLEVFSIPSREQRLFFRRLREVLGMIQPDLQARVTIVFHTPQSSTEHYASLFPQISGVEIVETLAIGLLPGGVGERPRVTGGLQITLERAA